MRREASWTVTTAFLLTSATVCNSTKVNEISTKNWPGIFKQSLKKSTKHLPNINQKSTKNRPKMDQKSVLEGSRGALGGSWRPRSKKHDLRPNFWGLLGPSWGRLGGLLGPSWRLDRRLGASWAVLGPSWAVLKSMSKSIKKSMPFKIGFGAMLMDFGRENGSMLALKSNKIDANFEKRFFEKT